MSNYSQCLNCGRSFKGRSDLCIQCQEDWNEVGEDPLDYESPITAKSPVTLATEEDDG